MKFKNLAERLEFFTGQVDIYPVVSSEFCNNRSVLDVIEQIGAGGAKIFQLRERTAPIKHCMLWGWKPGRSPTVTECFFWWTTAWI